MPKKIRVYELAHELGLTNKEALDLCLSLGMGVKSHSSSIEDAQADRARRKADREGLRRPVQPEEPAAPAKATKKAAAAKKVAATEQPDTTLTKSDGDIPPTSTPATSGTDGELPDGGGSTTPIKRSGARLVTSSRPAPEQPGSTGPSLVRSSPSPAAAPYRPGGRPAPPPPHRLPRVPHRHLPPLRRPRHRLRPLPPRPLPPRPLSPRPQRRRQPLSPRLRPRRYQHRRLPPPLRSAHPQQVPPLHRHQQRHLATPAPVASAPAALLRRLLRPPPPRRRRVRPGRPPANRASPFRPRPAVRPGRSAAARSRRRPAPVVGGLLLGPVAPVPVDPVVARAAAAITGLPRRHRRRSSRWCRWWHRWWVRGTPRWRWWLHRRPPRRPWWTWWWPRRSSRSRWSRHGTRPSQPAPTPSSPSEPRRAGADPAHRLYAVDRPGSRARGQRGTPARPHAATSAEGARTVGRGQQSDLLSCGRWSSR